MGKISIGKVRNMNSEMNTLEMGTFTYFVNDLQEEVEIGTYGKTLLMSDYSNRMVMPIEYIDDNNFKCKVFKFDYGVMDYVETDEVENVVLHNLMGSTLNANDWANHGDIIYFLSNGIADKDEVLSIWAHDEVGVGENDHIVKLEDVLFTDKHIRNFCNKLIGKSIFKRRNDEIEVNDILFLVNMFEFDIKRLGKMSLSVESNVSKKDVCIAISFGETNIDLYIRLNLQSTINEKFNIETTEYVIRNVDLNIK